MTKIQFIYIMNQVAPGPGLLKYWKELYERCETTNDPRVTVDIAKEIRFFSEAARITGRSVNDLRSRLDNLVRQI